MEQQVRFCKTSDGVRIAYAVVGQGIPLVKAANWLNHLEFDWKSPLWRPLLEDLAQDFRLVRYDERGNGLSDWDATNLSFDSFVSDLESVVEAAGLQRFALLGISQGGPVSIAYAVKHPERVSHLILYGAYPCGWKVRANPEEIRLRTAMLQLVEQGWGKENPAFRQIWTSFYIPGGTPEQMQWFNELQRVTTSPQNAIRLLTEFGKIDVRPLLSQVKVPTLVLHCQDDAAVPLESGRLIAAGIPGARFVTLPGKNHVPLPQDEAWHLMSAEIRRFLGVPERPVAVARPDAVSAATQIAPGAMVNQYRVGARLGAGGMGEVFRARDERLQRDVALKVLRVPAEKEFSARRRLLEEARAAAALAHPNICVVYEVGEAHDEMYIAMELVPGQPLAEAARSGALPPSRIAQIGAQLADALDHAHNNGVVHRDLKPGNVVVTPEGRAKILDFGLAVRDSADWAEATKSSASLADSRAIAGTLPYMPPEVLRGQPADARSDIWSLGVLLYELACGQPPFRGASGFELTSSILRDPLPNLPEAIPSGLAAVIRRCLEKDPAQRYQRVGEIRAALETISAQPVPAPETGAARTLRASADKTTAAPRRFFLRRSIVGGAGLGVLLVALAFFPSVRKRIFNEQTAAPKIESLAVLPLDNMTGDPAQEYFADGMTESLIANLAQIPSLRVISRTTVMRYKDSQKPLPEIARELGVDAVIEGSVARSGERVRVTAQMIEAATDRHLWAKEYDRDLRDVLALQSEVARAIAREIRVELTPDVQARLAATRAVKPEAYDTFLRGSALNRRENREDNTAAIELLEKSVSLDPNLATAHAELGRAYRIRSFFFAPQEKTWEQKAFAEVDRALALDPNSADAYLTRGTLVWSPSQGFKHEEAIRLFRRAIDLQPSLDEAHHQLGLVYLHIGLLERAQEAAEKALALNPGHLLALYRTGAVQLYQGNHQRAYDVFSRVPTEVNPALLTYQTALALFYLKRNAEAGAMLESYLAKHKEDEGGLSTSVLALLAASAGDSRRTEALIRRAIELGKDYGHFHHTAYNIAGAYALLNRPREALQWLQRAANDGFPCYPLYASDPNLDRIRRDAAFVEFLAKQKAQWERFKQI